LRSIIAARHQRQWWIRREFNSSVSVFVEARALNDATRRALLARCLTLRWRAVELIELQPDQTEIESNNCIGLLARTKLRA